LGVGSPLQKHFAHETNNIREETKFLPVREKPFGEKLAVGSRQLAKHHTAS